MSNHLEDLVAEWLEFNGYFVRKSVLVGRRERGGFEGELDVVGFHPRTKHLIHIECSLDADPWPKREQRFTLKFERGRRHIHALFAGIDFEDDPDQVALLGFGGGDRTQLGGARLMWVSDLIGDIMASLRSLSPDKRAVPSTLPNIRTLQLAAQPTKKRKNTEKLLPPKSDE